MAAAVAVLALVAGGVRAQAQAERASGAFDGINPARILQIVPELLTRLAGKTNHEVFRFLETIELLDLEAEIDRLVGDPRELNDATVYKLSLLPFQIRYPLYGQLVAQMTRLDNVRSNRIQNATPDSVSLIDLQLERFPTLAAMLGEGSGPRVQGSLASQFSAREIADLGVFALAQQPLFPGTDEGWQRIKHRIAGAKVPLALGALATGALFDAGALALSGNILGSGDGRRLKWYAGFRNLGVHFQPHLRAGLALRAFRLEAAAGLADQIRPRADQPDRALELALREGWLGDIVGALGWDAFFEVALRRAIEEPAGFTGEATTGRAGFFFTRAELPAFPDLALRGSTEAESDLARRLHMTAALGVEHSRSGIATVLQASQVSTRESSGLPTDARVGVFVVGTMEPISGMFADDMQRLARAVETEWDGLGDLDRRRDAWEQGLLATGAASRTPEQARVALIELERLVAEGEERLARLAAVLADYLESRRRACGILHRERARDDLHGPLDAAVLVAARGRVLARLRSLSDELAGTPDRLRPLQERLIALGRRIRDIERHDPGSPALAANRRARADVEQEWDRDAARARRQLAAHGCLHDQAKRMLAATEGSARSLRHWDTLASATRRLLWLGSFPVIEDE